MSNERTLENDDKIKKRENIKDGKNNEELKNEIKEWEVESTHHGD
ncbi:MAG TPA: hypothetical protein VFM31_11315 [Nitrososphaeraceae archaeon]|jgi:hypothetical protein|nr:hypothetical protein [Nitrososphaeraceae archaeon]